MIMILQANAREKEEPNSAQSNRLAVLDILKVFPVKLTNKEIVELRRNYLFLAQRSGGAALDKRGIHCVE